ncbi:MAG: SMC family ATPase [Acidilobaceae archaeon]|nr:SMC family ATPase [Acidilobaceae archaeon]
MMIRRVELRNVLSYEQGTVTFSPGINAIVGPNGSGKSSIVDAIIMALVGPCDRSLRTARTNVEEFVRIGAEEGSIIVQFEAGGRNYELKRTLGRRTGEPVVELRGEVKDEKQRQKIAEGVQKQKIAEGVQEVCRALSNIFGVSDTEVLVATSIARQGRLGELLTMGAAERKNAILDLAGWGRLEEARKILSDRRRALEAEAGALERRGKELEEKKRKREEERAKIEKMERELGELEAKARAAEQEAEEAKRAAEGLRRALEARKLAEELERVERELRELSRRAAQLPTALRDERLLEEASMAQAHLKYSLESLYKAERELGKELAERRQDLARGRLWQEVLKRSKGGLRELLEALWVVDRQAEELWLRELDRVEAELSALSAEELEERVRELTGAKGRLEGEKEMIERLLSISAADRCPYCGSPLSPERARHLAEERRRRLEEIKKEIAAIEGELQRLGEEKRRAEEGRKLLEKLRQARQAREEARRSAEDFLKACAPLAAAYGVEMRSPLDCPLERAREERQELHKLEERRAELEGKRAVLLSSMRALSVEVPQRSAAELEMELREAERRRDEAEKRMKDLAQKLGKLRGGVEELKKKLIELEEEIGRLEKEVEAAKIKKEIAAIIQRLEERVLGKDGQLAQELTRELRRRLEQEVNNILKEIRKEALDFRVGIDEGFEVYVVRTGPRGGDYKLNIRSLSGGERTMLAIALRMALARVLKVPADFMILDEPTEFLDEDARRQVFEMLPQLSQTLSQVIVITHDSEVEGQADKVILVEKRGGRSVIREERYKEGGTSEGLEPS